MTNRQQQNLFDCQDARCRNVHRCLVHWGKRCNRQGGRKVPRFRMGQAYDDLVLFGYVR